MARLNWVVGAVAAVVVGASAGCSSNYNYACAGSCGGVAKPTVTISASSADAACTSYNADCTAGLPVCGCVQEQ